MHLRTWRAISISLYHALGNASEGALQAPPLAPLTLHSHGPPLERLGSAAVGNPGSRGVHSSTFWINVIAFCGIGGTFRGCLGRV